MIIIRDIMLSEIDYDCLSKPKWWWIREREESHPKYGIRVSPA